MDRDSGATAALGAEQARAPSPLAQAGSDETSRARDARTAALGPADTSLPRSWDERIAHAVSLVGSPPVIAVVAMALVASQQDAPDAWAWAGVYSLFAIIAPLLYLTWLVRRGVVADLDVQIREQRAVPMAITLGCGQLAVLVLVIGPAPSPLIVVTAALWVLMAILFAVTLRWKISVHSATAAAVAALAWSAGGTPLPLFVGVPLVSWSRVRLGRHTLAQTAVGALLGCAVMWAALALARL